MSSTNFIKIASWNINSVRIRIDMLKAYLKESNIDVILLQETKCQDKDFPFSEVVSSGFNYAICGQKSYNGVAILSKLPLEVELTELPLYGITDKKDEEARYIEATFTVGKKFFRVASIYVPMGGSDLAPGVELEQSERFLYKLNFYKRLRERVKELKNSLNDEYIIFAGDYNVAHNPQDLHNPTKEEGQVGFHPLERANLSDIINLGLADAYRAKHPNEGGEHCYTWYDYRTRAFDRRLGWRIDYALCSKLAMDNLKDCFVDVGIRKLEKTSDHVPLVCEFAV